MFYLNILLNIITIILPKTWTKSLVKKSLNLTKQYDKKPRRKFTPEFKAKVALEAAKEQLTLAQLSQKFEMNAVTISKWKTEFLTNMSAAFSNAKETQSDDQDVPVQKLYAQIGKLKVELDFLKKSAKKLGIPESDWTPEN